MATPGLGLLLAFGLPMLPSGWSQETPDSFTNSTTQPPDGGGSNGGLSSEAIVAITVVFSILGTLLIAVGLFLLMRKLREKRQTEGTYRPSSEEQFSHAAAEARAPQDSKEPVRGCLPI
ncbi:crumbs homolog 3 (Drosophila), isoform CRA_b [Rattus norvegicus]|uniref:Crumbs cell polarity complex component 3 n=2 Tax=Rattus norvegicus TaxID=10116 RepID=A0A0G2JY65_RAT|nr:protein crumbs homolog 3 isoform X1 [Rattus norvegicus]XP_017451806.1 protein crumbs homolog 3 isoform X1 [Rattus norvegicus]EDL83584.1 crumbs homolog 3 (Drosophila), isoform CRA_b [Rattus norvegicus]|eukprot:XP_006244365.1 PREDICTED: protein crumbs homolog 3 isoform X1 [Rattus norvegicus]